MMMKPYIIKNTQINERKKSDMRINQRLMFCNKLNTLYSLIRKCIDVLLKKIKFNH